jgi:hypothetical protein
MKTFSRILVAVVLIVSSFFIFSPAGYAETLSDAQGHLKAGRYKEAETILTRLIAEKSQDSGLLTHGQGSR